MIFKKSSPRVKSHGQESVQGRPRRTHARIAVSYVVQYRRSRTVLAMLLAAIATQVRGHSESSERTSVSPRHPSTRPPGETPLPPRRGRRSPAQTSAHTEYSTSRLHAHAARSKANRTVAHTGARTRPDPCDATRTAYTAVSSRIKTSKKIALCVKIPSIPVTSSAQRSPRCASGRACVYQRPVSR
jgi:hypothetical protein